MHEGPGRMTSFNAVRPPLDPSLRRRIHGPIRPMVEPGLIEKALQYLRSL